MGDVEKTHGIDDALFTQLLDLGAALIACGGDVNLVETSLVRMGAAYGAVRTDAFVITSGLNVTVRDAQGRTLTQTRRIHTAMSNNFDKLERLNALCDRCCNELLSADAIERELAAIRDDVANRVLVYLGGVLAAASFALFFGGAFADAAVSAVFALAICLMGDYVKPFCPNEIVYSFVAALVSGVGICACVRLFPGLHGDMIIIGDIMLLIPGIAITNAMRDMLAGDTVAGALRFLEALLWTGALALGYMLAIWLVGAQVDSTLQPDTTVQIVCALPASLGFALLFNLRPKLLLIAAVGGLVTWAVYLGCGLVMEGVFFPCLVASLVAAVYAQVLARVLHAPISIFYIICEIPLIPGRGLYYTVSNAVQQNWQSMQDFAFMTGSYVVAIAFGIGIAWAIGQIAYRIAHR